MGAELDRDHDLLRRFREAGDRGALSLLVERYRGLAFRVALSVLRNPSDAEDATQDAFLNLLAYEPRIHADGSLAGLIARMALRAAQRVARSSGRRKAREHAWGLEAEGCAEDPAVEVAERETRRVVCEAVGSLRDSYRLPVVLHYIEGMSTLETAEALGISHTAVRSRLSRAVEKLRTHFERSGSALAPVALLALLRPSRSDAGPASLAARLEQLAAAAPCAAPAVPVAIGIGIGALKVKLAATAMVAVASLGGVAAVRQMAPPPPAEATMQRATPPAAAARAALVKAAPSQAVAAPVASRLAPEPPSDSAPAALVAQAQPAAPVEAPAPEAQPAPSAPAAAPAELPASEAQPAPPAPAAAPAEAPPPVAPPPAVAPALNDYVLAATTPVPQPPAAVVFPAVPGGMPGSMLPASGAGPAARSLVDDFEGNVAARWRNLAAERGIVREGATSGKWIAKVGDAVGARTPRQWNVFRQPSLEFWCHSAHATGARVRVILVSDNKATPATDQFAASLPVDWQGWKPIRLSLGAFAPEGKPAGLDKVEGLVFRLQAADATARANTALCFDDMWLCERAPQAQGPVPGVAMAGPGMGGMVGPGMPGGGPVQEQLQLWVAQRGEGARIVGVPWDGGGFPAMPGQPFMAGPGLVQAEMELIAVDPKAQETRLLPNLAKLRQQGAFDRDVADRLIRGLKQLCDQKAARVIIAPRMMTVFGMPAMVENAAQRPDKEGVQDVQIVRVTVRPARDPGDLHAELYVFEGRKEGATYVGRSAEHQVQVPAAKGQVVLWLAPTADAPQDLAVIVSVDLLPMQGAGQMMPGGFGMPGMGPVNMPGGMAFPAPPAVPAPPGGAPGVGPMPQPAQPQAPGVGPMLQPAQPQAPGGVPAP